MGIYNEPPNNSEPKPGEQEVEGENKKGPSPLCIYKRSEDVLQVASPSLGHVALHHVAISILEHDSFPYTPRTEAGLPVPAHRKVKVKVTLEQATKAQRGEQRFYSFFNLGARWGGWSTPRPGHFTPGKNPVPIVQEAGWAPGPRFTLSLG